MYMEILFFNCIFDEAKKCSPARAEVPATWAVVETTAPLGAPRVQDNAPKEKNLILNHNLKGRNDKIINKIKKNIITFEISQTLRYRKGKALALIALIGMLCWVNVDQDRFPLQCIYRDALILCT